jgi:VWFA-related protein
MIRWFPAACIVMLSAVPATQRNAPPAGGADLVELDVVVVDRDGRPITDVRKGEFEVKEDGKAVEIKTFSKVTALGSTQPDDGRVVTLLMDDIGVPIAGTSPMQQIAPAVLAPMSSGDELSVVRLSSRADEAFGDLDTARDRIAGYRGGVQPYSRRDTPETTLKAIAKIAKQLESIDHKRKIVICLGMPLVCDVGEPQLGGNSPYWKAWVDAITSTARANVSVYCVDPTGQRGDLNIGNGLIQFTGGTIYHDNNFAPAGEAIWREAGHYYLIGYWPPASRRELHDIDVRVARKGVRVRARQRR